jgi:beta-glucanase (GH16 family)
MNLSPRYLVCFLLTAAFAAALGGCHDPAAQVPLGWTLVWQDEFLGPAGDSPDPSAWSFDVGTNWGNAQLEYDTARPENASLDGNGNLRIIARKENYLGCAYTSARILTRGRFEQTGGRFEARARLPVGQGLWPAFWLLGANFGTVGWPTCGEIDIMEYRGQAPSTIYGSLHGPGYSGGAAFTHRYDLAGATFSADFHLFAVEWDTDHITWMVDDVPYMTVTPDDLSGGRRWVFDHPFYIILNVAVGGNYVGPPNASTSFPQAMVVDYVRVYRRKS